jgi:hypothetical protein
MADGGSPIQTIPNLPPAISLAGPEQLWINQAGVDRRAGIDDIANFVELQLGFAGSVVTSFNGRHGDILLTAADVTATGFGAGSFVPVTGYATVTGPLTFTPAAGRDAYIVLNKSASGPADYILGQTAGLARWQVTLGDTAPESGSNTGSNFAISATADDGVTSLGAWLSIARATGVVTITSLLGAGSGGTINNFTLDAGTF